MSNEVSLFRDQKEITLGSGGVDEITSRLLGNASYNRISIKGKKFRMIANGAEAASTSNPLDVVIVNAAPAVGRNYFAKAFNPKAKGEVADCWSLDGNKPDPRSEAPQSRTCADCPQNVAGSGQNGSRACKYLRRLAVVLGNDIGNSEIYQLQLPATSMFGKVENGNAPLDAYVKQLAAYRHSVTGVVTELRFDEDSESPKLFFRAVRPLSESEKSIVQEKGQTPAALAAITFNPVSSKKADEVPAPPQPAEPTVRSSSRPKPPEPAGSMEDTLAAWATDD